VADGNLKRGGLELGECRRVLFGANSSDAPGMQKNGSRERMRRSEDVHGKDSNRKNGNKRRGAKNASGVVERRLQVADDACDDEVRQDSGQRI
jgi:hypothetical protein